MNGKQKEAAFLQAVRDCKELWEYIIRKLEGCTMDNNLDNLKRMYCRDYVSPHGIRWVYNCPLCNAIFGKEFVSAELCQECPLRDTWREGSGFYKNYTHKLPCLSNKSPYIRAWYAVENMKYSKAIKECLVIVHACDLYIDKRSPLPMWKIRQITRENGSKK